jgi:hypothetical protein
MSAAKLHALLKGCGSDNMIGNMLCYDRLDLPVSPELTQRYLPERLVPSCDEVQYVGMNPTEFRGGQAAVCVNQTYSSILNYKDEARDGYIDPKAYKRAARVMAPLDQTRHHPTKVSMIADVTLNRGPLVEVSADSLQYAGIVPVSIHSGVIHGQRHLGSGF